MYGSRFETTMNLRSPNLFPISSQRLSCVHMALLSTLRLNVFLRLQRGVAEVHFHMGPGDLNALPVEGLLYPLPQLPHDIPLLYRFGVTHNLDVDAGISQIVDPEHLGRFQ